MPFPTTQQVNLPACSPHCPFNAERQAEKLWIPISKSLVWPDSESNPSQQLQRRTFLPLDDRSCYFGLNTGDQDKIWAPLTTTCYNYVAAVGRILRVKVFAFCYSKNKEGAKESYTRSLFLLGEHHEITQGQRKKSFNILRHTIVYCTCSSWWIFISAKPIPKCEYCYWNICNCNLVLCQ